MNDLPFICFYENLSKRRLRRKTFIHPIRPTMRDATGSSSSSMPSSWFFGSHPCGTTEQKPCIEDRPSPRPDDLTTVSLDKEQPPRPEASPPPPSTTPRPRCGKCDRRLGMVSIECECGRRFCLTHRYPEAHACTLSQERRDKDREMLRRGLYNAKMPENHNFHVLD